MKIKEWWYRLKESPFGDVVKRKHRFVVMDTDTFKEKFSFQLSGINLFVTVGITIIVLILLTTVLIAFTPMREWIPGYTNTRAMEQTYANAKKLDSLQIQVENQEWLVATMQAVLRGETPETVIEPSPDSAASLQEVAVQYRRSKEDSLLRAEVEREDSRYQVKATSSAASVNTMETQPSLSNLYFPPLKGTIERHYEIEHRGVDIAGDVTKTVCASYNGTVVLAGFTAETGQIIAIQHPGNVITVYQNCGSLLKRKGDAVRVGEPVAYVGSDGSAEKGTHLHFELWVNGMAVNPEEYISF